MALKIFSLTKIEHLADKLIATLFSDSAALDTFAKRQIIVPNKNIEKWLKLRIAQNQGVCAGVEFPFFDNFLFNTLAKLVDASKNFKQISEADLQLQIANIILSDDNEMLAPLRDYVFGKDSSKKIYQTRTARKLWQLSGKLANYIREYEFRRPKYINAFLSNDWIKDTKAILFENNANKEALVLAQAYLCRKLFMGIYPDNQGTLSLRQLLNLATKANHSKEKKTLYFFGLSTFSPIHANALHLLAQHYDVEFYHINVCMEYWGDAKTPWEKLKEATLNETTEKLFLGDDPLIENELLNAWGSAGRETMKLLVDLEEGSDTEYFAEDDFDDFETSSVLEALQKGIKSRSSNADEKIIQDSSVQILACPDQKREIETIYNSILDTLFHKQEKKTDANGKICSISPREDISLSDFAILVPNMAKYRPIIETVFNSRGELPYGLLDSAASAESHYLRGVIELLTIAQFCYTRSSMVSLLSNPCVMETWNYSDDDLAIWIEYIDKLGIHHHFSHDGLEEDGLIAGDEFTWDYALSRLRLGLITTDEFDSKAIPLYTTNNMYKERIEKLSALIETIYHATNPFKSKLLTIAEWLETLLSATGNILGTADERMQGNIISALKQLENDFSKEAKFHSALILEYLKDKLSNISCSRGSFLTSGVTIAAMQPMRPIPFKYIYVVGLGEGEFPGNNQESTLDIRALKRMLGDTSFASRNLYLFLELVMSARERLVLSYVAKDTKKDIEKYPSPVINQLERFLKNYIISSDFKEFIVPLQEYIVPKIDAQDNDKFANLRNNYNNFITIGKNISQNIEYKNEILEAISSKEKLQDKLSRSLYNLKPDFNELIQNQGSLEKTEEIYYWSSYVLADFLKNSRQAILKHVYLVASKSEEIDTTKDTAPKAIDDENKFVSTNLKKSIFSEILNRRKCNNSELLNNKDAAWIISSSYFKEKRQSMTPVGVVGDYDIRVQTKSILGENYEEEPDEPCKQNANVDSLINKLPEDGEWVKINIGKHNSTNEEESSEKELAFPALSYSFKNINNTDISIFLGASIDNVYIKDNSIFYIPNEQANSESRFLSTSLLNPLLSIIMYVASQDGSKDENIYSIIIKTINTDEKNTQPDFEISLSKKEAADYINLLVSEMFNPDSIKQNYQYQCLCDVINQTAFSKNNKPKLDIERKIRLDRNEIVEIVENIINYDSSNQKEYNLNISSPPYCEGAIIELFPEIKSIDEAFIENFMNILNTRYYIPMILPLKEAELKTDEC